jgi:class 3 adenylate cyclase
MSDDSATTETPLDRAGGRDPRLERLIETSERPLLVLAVVAMVLYLVDLRDPPGWPGAVVSWASLAIDVIFLADLVVKLLVYRRAYADSPWFLVDLLSCLPLLGGVAEAMPPIRVLRLIRSLRILRVLRGLRLMRAVRAFPEFERFARAGRTAEGEWAYHRVMNLGLLGLTAAVLLTLGFVRGALERDYLARIDRALADGVSSAQLAMMGGRMERPQGVPTVFTRSGKVDGRVRLVYFDLRPVEARFHQAEFFLSLGMMLSTSVLMYLMSYHHRSETQTQIRGLLNLALPRQVAESFVADPDSYGRKSRTPATVVFMDLVGFTRTCESLAHDPDILSTHLEAALDRIVGVLVRHDMIIDKFIGDAVMSFRGGPLVEGTPADHALRAVLAALDSTRALVEFNDPYFTRVKIGGASDEDCLIGAFGTSARLSYTILGNGVNLAARLEPASAQCGTQNLFCERTHRLCAGRPEVAWRRWGWVRIEGLSEPVEVFEALDSRSGCGVDTGFLATFHLALDAFEHHDFDRARDLFLSASSQRPGGDPPSRLYAHRCESLLLRGRPVGWEPVFETHK